MNQDLEERYSIISEGCKVSQEYAEKLHAEQIRDMTLPDNAYTEKIERLKEMAKAQKERAIAKKTRYFVSGKDKASGTD